MKRKLIIIILSAVSIGMVALFGACDLLSGLLGGGISAASRVDRFEADVAAGNYGQLYTHFYEGRTDDYQTIASETYWQNTPFWSTDYEDIADIGAPEVSGSTTTIAAVLQSGGNDYDIEFELQEAPDGNFYIVVLDYLTGGFTDIRLLAWE